MVTRPHCRLRPGRWLVQITHDSCPAAAPSSSRCSRHHHAVINWRSLQTTTPLRVRSRTSR